MTASPEPARDRISVTFANAEQADRAVTDLERAGIDRSKIQIHSGAGDQDTDPGRTGPEDELIAERMGGAFVGGGLTGAIVGGTVGAIVGGLVSGWFTVAWAGALVAGIAAGGGVGVLWGLMTGFRRRPQQTGGLSSSQRPAVRDEVTVTVETHGEEAAQARELLYASGGEQPPPRFPS